MSAADVSLRCWLDPDGKHVWQAHDCVDHKTSVSKLPWPVWRALPDGKVTPSIICDAGCRLHAFGQIGPKPEDLEGVEP